MACEQSSINCSKVCRFTAIKLQTDDCKKVTCCKSVCGDVCNNGVPSCLHYGCKKDCSKAACCKSVCGDVCNNGVPSCLHYGCKKDCSKAACCKSVCSNSCVPSCHHYGSKAAVIQDGCKRGEACAKHLHGCFKEASCEHLTSCHHHNIKHDCRCRRPNEVINLKTSCKSACDDNNCQ